MIYLELGLLALVAVFVFAFLLFLQSFIDKGFKNANIGRLIASETRIKKINEVITGMKIVKFNGWEKIMNDQIKKVREEEGRLLFKSFAYFNISQAIGAIIPTALSLGVFITYELYYGKKLEVAQIYELIALFNATLAPIRYFIMGYLGRSEAIASAKRIGELTEVEPIQSLEDDPQFETGDVSISRGCFNWEDPKYYKMFEGKKMSEEMKNTYILKNIDVSIKKGEFIAVVGKVGAGKSSLLLAMMNEMVKHRGQVRKNGRMAYISQETFLQNETIKENILFGKQLNQQRYEKVLKICEMGPDLDMLPGRDLTEIGERGLNMSGGQKQRVNIARAVYSDSDIYLIDDALSALDAYVGKKIMNNVFLNELAGKTRVMVTHFLHLLEKVDKVILIESGEIKAFGTLEEIRKTQAFRKFSNSQKHKKKEEEETKKESLIEEIIEHDEVKSKEILKEQKVENDEENLDKGKLVKKEHRETGIAGFSNFLFYSKSAGNSLVIFTFFLFIISVGMKIGCDWWIGKWMEDSYNQTNEVYMILYAAGGTCVFILMIFRAWGLASISQKAALYIFKSLFWNILRRPMSFFDTTSTGVIINRCTKDMDNIDFELPFTSAFFFNTFFTYIGSIILATVISPLILVLVILGILIFVPLTNKFLKTTVEITRIAQVTLSPIISISSEFIDGASIIRTYGRNHSLLMKYKEKADIHQTANFLDYSIILWLRFRIETFFNLTLVAIIFSIVVDQQYK